MAKGQKRSNREIKKPKANKSPAAGAPSSMSAKGRPALGGMPNKKG